MKATVPQLKNNENNNLLGVKSKNKIKNKMESKYL